MTNRELIGFLHGMPQDAVVRLENPDAQLQTVDAVEYRREGIEPFTPEVVLRHVPAMVEADPGRLEDLDDVAPTAGGAEAP